MTRKYFLLFQIIFICWSHSASSQSETALKYSELITSASLRNHLAVLASDSMEGRETATVGMKKAAAYVSGQFRQAGLMPASRGSYLQNLPLIKQNAGTFVMVVNDKNLNFGSDFFPLNPPDTFHAEVKQIVFAGYGIDDSVSKWNDYEALNTEGKIVMILDGEPVDRKGNSKITGDSSRSKWSNDRKLKTDIAIGKKALAVLFVVDDMSFNNRAIKRWMSGGRLQLPRDTSEHTPPVIYISKQIAKKLTESSGYSVDDLLKRQGKTGKSESMNMKCNLKLSFSSEKVSCTNVMAYVEGTDLKNEVVVLSAHLDHLGKRDGKIYYGADDDGSGCAAVVNMAETFAKASADGKGPRRSILFITFSGEEKGLLGSKHYVNNPVFPLENTIVNLNIDMIGRSDTIPRNTTNYTYIIGSDKMSSELHEINESINAGCCEVRLDYKYNDPKDPQQLYYRSDHYSFVKNGIPAIFYFTGLHEDYHQPTDTIDKIDFGKMESITRLIFNTAWELANRDKRIEVDILPE